MTRIGDLREKILKYEETKQQLDKSDPYYHKRRGQLDEIILSLEDEIKKSERQANLGLWRGK